MITSDKRMQLYFFVVVFVGVLAMVFYIFMPFFIVLAVAGALAVVCQPIHRWVLKKTRNREGLSAFLTILITSVIIIVPFIFISGAVFQNARELSIKINTRGSDDVGGVLLEIQRWINGYFPDFSFDFGQYLKITANWLANNLQAIFSGVGQVLFNLFIGLMAFYYFLKDGKKLAKAIIELSPLSDKYDRKILNQLVSSVNSVIKGSLTIAIIQGFLTGVGLVIFGVPNAALLGSVTVIAALIPGIGTTLVLLPCVIYLFVIGSTGAGIGLAIWAIVAVGLIDNYLSPKLMGRGMPIHPFIILLSVIGGLGVFGPIGFLLGPLFVSLFLALLEIQGSLVEKK